jgi:HK97 family phage prohead protease
VRFISTRERRGERFQSGASAVLTAEPAPVQERSVGVARARSEDEATLGVMSGHFAVFDRWTEIDSPLEGHFLERIMPGAFKKTFEAHDEAVKAGISAGIKVMFNHGRDPSCGMMVLGTPTRVEEDDIGARYEVEFFDTSYNRDLAPALRRGDYGASFRFVVRREEVNDRPLKSSHNPARLEERSIIECSVAEFGPVSWPAYKDASAQLRSALELVAPAPESKPRAREHADPVRRHRLLRDSAGPWLLTSPDAQCSYSSVDSPVRVRLSEDVQEAMLTRARSLSDETGGLLFGSHDDGFVDVARLCSDGPGAVRLPTTHRLDGSYVVRAIASMRSEGFAVVGHWHSHTDPAPPLPSDSDLAAWSSWRRSNELERFIGVIVSPRCRGTQVGAWVVRERERGRHDVAEVVPL